MSRTMVDTVNERGATVEILLPAVTMTLGLQLWRALFALLLFVLRDRFGWSAVEVGALALAVFLTGLFAGPLRRWLGPGLAVALTAGGAGLFRLVLQVWSGEATVELGLALAGSVFFILSLPNLLGGHERAGGRLALGILLGLTLDLALHGFWRTYDLSWQAGAGALLVTGLLVAIQLALLARVVREGDHEALSPLSPAWLALGPYLFLTLLVWQNLARLTVLTGWSQALAFAWMVAGQGVALAGVLWLVRGARLSARTLAGAGLVLLVTGLLPWWPEGGGAAVSFLMGHAGGALALAGLLCRLSATQGRRKEGRALDLAHGATMFLFVALAFFYYSGFDISLPFSNRLLPLLAAVLLGVAALGASWSARAPLSDLRVTWRPALLAAALLALPLYRLATAEQPKAAALRFPLRVMTYNIHNGFDMDGYLGMEAVAAVIEAQEPDVVALQEVSRGWVTNGSVDTLAWLAQRLDMHAHYAPTADDLWGMGILSRAPIIEEGSAMLPPEDLLLKRGYQWAVVEVGEDGRLTVVNTHLHHPETASDVRVEQARTLVEAWSGTSPMIVAGDFNARPSDPEMELIAGAGLEDVVGATGLTPGYTFSSRAPYKQIDYIWLSADLTAVDVTIPSSTASDHFPIAATVRRRPMGKR